MGRRREGRGGERMWEGVPRSAWCMCLRTSRFITKRMWQRASPPSSNRRLTADAAWSSPREPSAWASWSAPHPPSCTQGG